MRALDLDDRYITVLEVYKGRASLCQTSVTLRLLDADECADSAGGQA